MHGAIGKHRIAAQLMHHAVGIVESKTYTNGQVAVLARNRRYQQDFPANYRSRTNTGVQKERGETAEVQSD